MVLGTSNLVWIESHDMKVKTYKCIAECDAGTQPLEAHTLIEHIHHRENINLAVLALIEDGNMTRLKNKWWFDRNECTNSDKQDAHNELSLSNVAGIFFILIVGLVVALIVALVEFCMSRRKAAAEAAVPKAPTMSTATLKSKAELTIQGGRDYDNGRSGVSVYED